MKDNQTILNELYAIKAQGESLVTRCQKAINSMEGVSTPSLVKGPEVSQRAINRRRAFIDRQVNNQDWNEMFPDE